jgi:hypothetical protein
MKHNWLFWLPRIFVILFALFTMIFSFDVFGMQAPWYRIALGFVIHNIPFFVLMLLLFLVWKRPAFGSIVFFLVMIPFALIVRTFGHIMTLVYFMAPPFIVGLLFLFDYFQQMKFRKDMELKPTALEPDMPGPIDEEPKEVEPIEPIEPIEHVEPIESIEPIEPVEPEEKELKEKKSEDDDTTKPVE